MLRRFILRFLIVLLLLGCAGAWILYFIAEQPNVLTQEKKSKIIFIPSGSGFEQVMDTLRAHRILKNEKTFLILARLKKYPQKVKAGRYRILPRISNNELVNLLRSGMQEPVTLTLNNIRTKEQLVSRICSKLEVDSTELATLLNRNAYMHQRFGLKSETALCLFIPNSYEFFWNTSAEKFLEKIAWEYKKFWNGERMKKTEALGLTPAQVSILASMVQAEQLVHPQERPVIAGLFLNRLRIGMALQSDPTVVYAVGDFSIQRVLNKDKEIDSPYNTYKYPGLPPGPILLPDIASIDAVLNYEKNNYLFMCAKEDFSGFHNFARTLEEHNRNAKKYRDALNKKQIFR